VAIKSKVVYVCVSERFCGLNLKLDVTSKKKIFPIFLQQSELVILHRLDIASCKLPRSFGNTHSSNLWKMG